MKPEASIVLRILLAIALYFCGLFFYERFVALYLFDADYVTYSSLSRFDQAKHVLSFSICLAAIPLASLFLKLKKLQSIIISMAIISGFLIFGVVIKWLLFLVMIENHNLKGGQYLQLSLDKVLPELYMIVALVIGYFLLQHLKKREILFPNDSPDLGKEIISQLPSN